MNCLPRGKLPALRWTLPRALCWVSGIASPLVRMSLRAMILLQAPVGLRENAVAIFRELLADDDVERELLELADPGDPTLAEGQQPGGRQEGVHGRAQEVGRGAAALGRDRRSVVEGKRVSVRIDI